MPNVHAPIKGIPASATVDIVLRYPLMQLGGQSLPAAEYRLRSIDGGATYLDRATNATPDVPASGENDPYPTDPIEAEITVTASGTARTSTMYLLPVQIGGVLDLAQPLTPVGWVAPVTLFNLITDVTAAGEAAQTAADAVTAATLDLTAEREAVSTAVSAIPGQVADGLAPVEPALAAVDQSILRADAAAARVEADVDRTFETTAWGVADETGRAALSIDLNGDTTVHGALTAAGAVHEPTNGVAWAIADITGRMALYVDDQGVTHGTFVDMSAMTLPLPTRDITAWGDSMTEGAGTPNFEGAWLTQLAQRHPDLMAGRTLRKRGIIGQTAEQIAARAGGWTVRLRIPQPIPASGPSAGIWITTAVGDVNRTEPHCREFRGRVAGIPGTLRLADDGTYTWERDTPGAPIPVPAEGVVWTPDVDWRATVVLWAGRNGPDRVSTFAEIRSVTDRLLTQVAAPRYLVLSVVNAADEPNGHPTNNVIQALNIRLMELYGDRYVDVRGAVTAGRADGTPDPQYMAPDGLHFNATGYALVADLVAAALTAKGW